MDNATKNALLSTIRGGLRILKPRITEAEIDERARNIVQSFIGQFEIRLLDEPTDPMRGRAGT